MFASFFKSRERARAANSAGGRRRGAVLRLESLEDRLVLNNQTTLPGIADWGTQFYSAFVNTLENTDFDYAKAVQGGKFTYLTLGFVDANASNQPAWDGQPDTVISMDSNQASDVDKAIVAQVDSLRSNQGDDAMVSFGGARVDPASPMELAQAISTSMGTGPDALKQLVADYQAVIDEYQLKRIDFDLEGLTGQDAASIGLRSQAIHQLQLDNHGLQVYYTLEGGIPLNPYGMSTDASNIVQSALDNGVVLSGVNLMTMDFSNGWNYYDRSAANDQLYGNNGMPYAGDQAPDGVGTVAGVAIDNAKAEHDQLQQMYAAHNIAETDAQIWQLVGITPEIGRNYTGDGSNVIFSTDDAQTVETFAKNNGVGLIAIWSINRDQPGNPTDPHSEDNSSFPETPYQFSQIFTQINSTTTPAAPTELTATGKIGEIDLSFTASANATSYNVYRGTASGAEGNTPYATGLTATSFADTAVTAGTIYYYTVTAVNGGGESASSTEASAASTMPPPGAPTGVAASGVVDQVNLSWSSSTDAVTYNIYRGTTSGAEDATAYATGLASTSFADSAVTPGTAYFYVITAVNGSGESAWSAEVSATPMVPPPAAPTGVLATAAVEQINLTWSASSGAATYNIYRATTSGSEGTSAYASGLTGASFADSAVSTGTTYFYLVTAVNGSGESVGSVEVSAAPMVPRPAAPSGLSATGGTNQATLTWSASSGATTYNVYRGASSGAEGTTAYATGLTSTSFTDSAVTARTPYFYVVTAVNGSGESSVSDEVSATPIPPPPPVPVQPPAKLGAAAVAFTHSREYYANFITAAYQQYLGRGPDNFGLKNWIAAMQSGLSDERLEAGFIGSPEYIANHGGDGADWIIGMYRDLLGREPDSQGLANWQAELAQGVLPSSIAYGFAASAEREGERITGDYLAYLGRKPESATVINNWVQVFLSGTTNESVIAGFVASPEYFNQASRGDGNVDFWISSAYHDVLHRDPTATEMANWEAFLA
jgi:fibronectin type 3 domain-containing protein